MIKIAPSLLSADAARLAEEVAKVEAAGADWIHIDVMDGHFVPNLTYGVHVVKCLRKVTKLPLDVHLMIENPDRYIPKFVEAGAAYVSFHIEASTDVARDIRSIRESGAKPALAVSPSTPIEKTYPYLDQLDFLLAMTVNPGFEKQDFIPEVLPKIRALRKELNRRGQKLPIQVDGGIKLTTAKEAVEAGAEILVAGSAIYYAKDPGEVIQQLKNLS